ncbi:L-tryptophan decarboxylase-like [Dendronephthya gigantea]|uniref:L-tryptophan decarboxylase-like n=1 Tax=Dendronephthya gigantea TaxID=151771 RepID=UPI001068D44A|nr:L-tryptophan decarboxylase-like [Dendronephthya gigantea]XP_028390668.1 L-tryptophan decarboxylase-like [Dendronephthya gigantea]
MEFKREKLPLVIDRNKANEWLATLIQELRKNEKDKVDLMFKLYPPAVDENSAKNNNRYPVVEKSEIHLHPPVEALMNAILRDPEINMFFHQIFWQQQELSDNKENPIWCWQIMILLFDMIMTRAPEFNRDEIYISPIYVALSLAMATKAGFSAFCSDKVNKLLKDILNYWGEFLCSSASTYVLNDDEHSGWFGKDAMEVMPNFTEEYECDSSKLHYGFTSWDDFFARKYREGIRPVEAPDDNSVVVNACESEPFKIAYEVKQRDLFWIKSQYYSLDHMLNNDDLAKNFYGGTVYQAFLSSYSYHRWHSPVSGYIVKTELVDGSYYSQTQDLPSDALISEHQGYLCHVAARGIIYINADNPDIGLMVFISIGMNEVSSNEITVKVGDHVKKGDEIGAFHFGGSSHCLVFQPWVKIMFHLHGAASTPSGFSNIPVKSKIAVVSKARM